MNRLTRITAILTQLQSKKIVTAKELADRFEVSLRTIYRDVRTLQGAGVPIGSENGLGYFIVDGYSLPPIMIKEEEANALLMAEKIIRNQGDSSLIKDFVSVATKIKSILRNSEKENLSKLENRVISPYFKKPIESKWLSRIQKAIVKSTILEITYRSIYKNETTNRKIEPLGIYLTENNTWVAISFCRLRKELREFRLDRILDAKELQGAYHYQEDFTFKRYFSKYLEPC